MALPSTHLDLAPAAANLPGPDRLLAIIRMQSALASGPRELSAPNGTRIELVDAEPPVTLPPLEPRFVLTHMGNSWGTGRAVAKRAELACTYAEGFRRTRFGGIESLSKDQQIAEDV